MSIATVLIAAAGWILAAFLCGLAVGRGEGPPEDGKAGKNPARRENNRHSAGGKGPAGMAEFFN